MRLYSLMSPNRLTLMNPSLQLDSTDRAILHYLQACAKLTNAQLAQHIGLSPASTLERVRKLERQGVIKSYHAKLDPRKLALHTFMLVQLKVHPLTAASVTALQETIANIPEVVACYQVIGDVDFVLQVVVTDIATYQQRVVHRLSEVKGIQHLKASIVTATLKETGIPVTPPHTAPSS